ncbi:hypothetical protein COLO4_06105 [Corchorus olitorius]|uniref:Retrotransposon Copia-like N-terminal domain-containing protein n=1 Tax=Corchorus olitorius TaxID=93759 RepID=A0A1R3KNY9_9ROSI|nr:hypothetical protein COLO4_06105 [Corchorus olitorius]
MSLKLISYPLTNLNYVSWSRAAYVSLTGRGKLMLIEGDEKVPDKDNPKANTAKELWESIKTMYSHQNNVSRIYQLKKEIIEIKQGAKSSGRKNYLLTTLSVPFFTMKKAIQPEKNETVEASAMMTVKSDEEEETKIQQHTYKGKAKTKPRCDHCQ